MIVLAAVLIGAAVVLLLPGGSRRRLRAPRSPGRERRPVLAGSSARIGVSALAGLAVGIVMGGAVGVVVGAGVLVLCVRLLGRLVVSGAADEQELGRQAPEAAELLAACLASGATLESAGAAVAAACPEPLSGLLSGMVAQLRLGASPEQALAGLAAATPTAAIARAVQRSLASGAPLAVALELCAEELRDRRRAALETRARQVAVRSVAPLGVCFLPAFLLLGVVPLVAGLLTKSLGPLLG